MPYVRTSLLLGCLLALTSCAGGPAPDPAGVGELAKPLREFRGVWVATVANIDWPSRPGGPPSEQRAEALALLDRIEEVGANAVVLQVRPAGDAFYPSSLEPWSWWLTGEQGAAPAPSWDPLAFWIEEAHARGLELHAWINPYRARHPSQKGPLHELSLVRRRPDLVVELAREGYAWMLPTEPEVQAHTLAVVEDLLRRYPLDGIHMDDYFYPYPSYNAGEDFPDGDRHAAWQEAGGTLDRDAWRREAVDEMVRRLHELVRRVRPEATFSLSPFGIWRPGHPAGIAGFDQFAELHADARRWLREGWVDAFVPQLYWPIRQEAQSFPVLLAWWERNNPHGRHLWPGTTLAKEGGEAGAREVVNQMMISRAITPRSPGLCLFSARWLMGEDSAFAGALAEGPWRRPAILPRSVRAPAGAPPPPSLTIEASERGVEALLSAPSGVSPRWWVLEVETPSGVRTLIRPGTRARVEIALSGGEDVLAVEARLSDRFRRMSRAVRAEFEPASPARP